MTDQNSTEVDEDTPIGVSVRILADDTVELHQVGFGLGLPKILLGIEEDEEGEGLTFTALAAGFDDVEEMISMARQHLDVLEMAAQQESGQ